MKKQFNFFYYFHFINQSKTPKDEKIENKKRPIHPNLKFCHLKETLFLLNIKIYKINPIYIQNKIKD